MKTGAIDDNPIALTRFRLVNAYLVAEEDGLTLVDTLISGSADALIVAARQAGAPIRPIALMPELDARTHAGEKVVEGKLPGSRPKLLTTPDMRLKGG
jgi:hypothetical protein